MNSVNNAGRSPRRGSIEASAFRAGPDWPTERVFRALSLLAALTIVLLLVAIALRLSASSVAPWQRFGLNFLLGMTWDVTNGVYGALPFIAGTIESSLLALVIAVPISLLTAIFLAELAPRWLAVPLT